MHRLALPALFSAFMFFVSVQEAAALKLSFEFHGLNEAAVRLSPENRGQDRQRDFAASAEACLRVFSEPSQQRSCQNFYQIMVPALVYAVNQVADALLVHAEETKDVVLRYSFIVRDQGLPGLQATLLYKSKAVPARSMFVLRDFATLVPANQKVLLIEGMERPFIIRFAAIDPVQMLNDGRAFPWLIWPGTREP